MLNITMICLSITGIIFSIIYVVLAYFVTQKGDFYQNRHWKASILVAVICSLIVTLCGFVFLALLFLRQYFEIKVDVFEILLYARLMFLCIYVMFFIPYLFVITIGIYFRLGRQIDMDDILDKIWQDPNIGYKSPIQDI